ncbi:MAG: DUF2254 domain-containing protein, partial [Chloroflexota bacterium]
ASQQFGPRLLGNFMRDRASQAVMAVLIGASVYALLVLWSIQDDGQRGGVPQGAMAGAMLWASVGLGMIIYFIHHVAESIRLSRILAGVSDDLNIVLERTYPTMIGRAGETNHVLSDEALREVIDKSQPVIAERSGYIQTINGERLMEIAVEHDLLVVLELRPGQFMASGQYVAYVRGGGQPPGDDVLRGVESCFIPGIDRSETQDIYYPFEKYAEVANKAMSPAINDPYTAVMCLDRIGAGLLRFMNTQSAYRDRYDDAGKLRVVAVGATSLDALLNLTMEQLRFYASDDLHVLTHMLYTLGTLARHVSSAEEATIIDGHVERTYHYVKAVSAQGWDKLRAQHAYEQARRALQS